MIVFYFLPFLGSLASNNLRTSNLSYHKSISVSLVKTCRIYKMQWGLLLHKKFLFTTFSHHLITYITSHAPIALYSEVQFGSVNENWPTLRYAKLCAIMSPRVHVDSFVLSLYHTMPHVQVYRLIKHHRESKVLQQ